MPPRLPRFPPDPAEWLPRNPLKSPLPSWVTNDDEPPKPSNPPAPSDLTSADDVEQGVENELGDYELVLRKRGTKKPHLKKFQPLFTEALKFANEQTSHLSGEARMGERGRLISEYLKSHKTPAA